MTEEKKKSGEISRREFLKDAGLLVGGTAIGSTILLAACGGGDGETVTKTVTEQGGNATVTTTEQVGEVTKTVTTTAQGGSETITITKTVEVQGSGVASENVINLTVNGQKYEMQVEPNWTLRYVIHDKLGLTGTKEWCDRGACGSCTVIIEGRPVLACMMLAIECDGAEIETAEGIADSGHPIIEAYIMAHCMQCGYCTPGFVVTAKALLDKNDNPTEADVIEALNGNICRCATYPAHIVAVLDAAEKIRGGA